MTQPQWWLDETGLDLLALCEHLAERTSPNPEYIDDFAPPSGKDLQQLVAYAESQNLLRTESSWADGGRADLPVVLLPSGRRRIDSVHERRSRTSERVNAARQGLLLWAYDHAMRDPDLPMTDPQRILRADPPYNFWGEPFTEANVVEATDYLLRVGLLELIGARLASGRPQNVQITHAGKDCVENYDGSVGGYLNRAQQPSMPSITNNNNQHFNAPVTGMVAQGEHITQTQHNGLDPAVLVDIFTTLRDVVANNVDDADDRDDLETIIVDLEREVRQPQVDPALVTKRIGLLRRTADRMGNTALTVGTTAATSGLLDLLGNVIT